MPHRYRRSTRSASHTRKINPTLARLRTSSSTTLNGARGSLAKPPASGLRPTSSAVVKAGHSGDGGGGLVSDDEASVDDDRLSGHVVAVATGEEAHAACHVVRALRAPQWDDCRTSLPRLADAQAFDLGPIRIDARPHRRVHRTRADAI